MSSRNKNEIKTWSDISKQECVEAGIILIIIVAFLAIFDKIPPSVLIYGVIVVGFATLILPSLFRPFAYLWYNTSTLLAKLINPVVMGVVYLLLVLPVGMLMKVVKRDALRLSQWKRSRESVFISRKKRFSPSDFEKIF